MATADKSPNTPKPEAIDPDDGMARQAKGSRSAVQLIYDNDDISERLANDRKFVWALARGLEIIRAYSAQPAPLGNSELSQITGLPKATISRLTHTLTELGYLRFLKRLGKYELAPSVLSLGYPVISSMKIRLIARDYLQQLANDVNLSVALASRDRLSMIYVDACHPSSMMTLRLDLGSRVDIPTSAIGRSFLWGIAQAERDYIFQLLERRHGAAWPDLHSRILGSFEEIERRGFCIVDGEWQRDVRGVGVPLVSADGSHVMALNAAGPRFAASLETLETVVGPRLVHLSRSVAPMLER